MDTEGLLRSLNERSVRYVLIGATAFPVHGYARATLDVDVFIEPSLENAGRADAALAAFGCDLSDISVQDLVQKEVLIRQRLVAADIHPFVAGLSFDEVWQRRVLDTIGDTLVPVASLDDLIRMKRAAGRAKDLEDLRVLQRLRDRRR